jgi:hypothetical protein
MAITVDWALTKVIFVPRADMTLIQTTPYEVRELDSDAFRLILRDLEDDPDGRPWPRTHDHNTEVTIQGVTYARQVLIKEPYTITFEDGLYAVNIVGSNNNILERTNKNSVSVNPSNSAGLQKVVITVESIGDVLVDCEGGYVGMPANNKMKIIR